MPRSGGGVYSLPDTYEATAGETILATQHNTPLEDLAADANEARPVVAGGTGATTATAARTNLSVPFTTASVADPTVNEDTGDGYGRGSIHVNTNPLVSSGRFFIAYSVGSGAAAWYGLAVYKATNIMFGTGCGASLTTGDHNVIIGSSAGRAITSGADNTVVGDSAGKAIAATNENTYVGSQAGVANALGNGHTLIGYNAGAALNSAGNDYNTFIGHSAGILATGAGSCTVVGRAAGRGITSDGYATVMGHAAMFYGGGTVGCVAIGNGAGGEPVDGSSLINYGLVNDGNVTLIGSATGKTSAAGRTNCFAIGYQATIPVADDVGVFGKSLRAVVSKGNGWFGMARNVVNANSGQTLTAAQMCDGFVSRTGTLAADFADTTPTAAQLVAQGPGAGCEVPVGRYFHYFNGTSKVATLTAGSGASVSGGGTVAAGTWCTWMMVITASDSGSETVTFYRVTA